MEEKIDNEIQTGCIRYIEDKLLLVESIAGNPLCCRKIDGPYDWL